MTIHQNNNNNALFNEKTIFNERTRFNESVASAFTKGKAFIPFITAGFPSIELSEQLILTMAESGADLIEIGIPFSDPVAEGEVIQRASHRALVNGVRLRDIFAMVDRIREKTHIPLAFMTYANPIIAFGIHPFLAECQRLRINALIVPDLPFEERSELSEECLKNGISLIPLIAPTSNNRIAMIARQAEGFIYCVSSLGVTGVRDKITSDLNAVIEQIRAVNSIPCAIGFGIATQEQAREMAKISDGIIVGSALIRLIENNQLNPIEAVKRYTQEMKAAITNS